MMPLVSKPGVNLLATPLLNAEGWSASNLVRWKDGYLQKLGGCSRLTNDLFRGICRGLHAWADLNGNTYLGAGTTSELALFTTGTLGDITPIRHTSELGAVFSTVSGSDLVTVADAGFSPAPGDWVIFDNAVYAGGIFLQGAYPIASTGSGNYVITAGTKATSTVTNGGSVLSFTTAIGSGAVTLALGAYAFTNNQDLLVYFQTVAGGLTIPAGNYTVAVSGGIATITVSGSAGSVATVPENSGNAQVQYPIATAVETSGSGAFGEGPYGAGPFGVGSANFGAMPLRQWSVQNWGQNLLAVYTGSTLYQWAPPIALGNVAAAVSGAPTAMNGMTVSAQEQIAVGFGCTDPISGEQDPLLMRWSDVANNADWTATTTNQAGSFRIPTGSKVVGMVQGPLFGLVWTDIDFWIMQYIGFPLVFSFNRIGWGCGLIGMRAAGKLGEAIYWMGQDEFFVYTGAGAQQIPCPVWDFVFANLDRNYADAVFAASNSYFGEIAWYFPTLGSNGVCQAYVKLQVATGLWDYGYLSRSAWADQSAGFAPVGSDYTGLLQQHETSPDLDGDPMDAWAETGWIEMQSGTVFTFLERIIPDFILSSGGRVLVTLNFADYPNESAWTYGPYEVTSSTRYLIIRGRGRYVQLKVESNDLGTFWRLGKPTALISEAGRR